MQNDRESKYRLTIENSLNTDYILGVSDCTTFVADIVQSVSGVDIAKRSRGKYDSLKSMFRFLKENGGIKSLVSETLGEPRKNVLESKRGDVLEIEGEGGTTLAICDGEYALHKNNDGTISRVDMSLWVRGWKVCQF